MGVTERPDSELLSSGRAEDFGCFYDRHLNVVVAFIGARVREPEAVFDLCAETFARALAKRSSYDPTRGPAVGWLLGIARHLIIEAWRRGRIDDRSRVKLGMEPVALDDEQVAVVAERGRVDLRAALGALPADQREAVLRRVVLEETYGAIADTLRCSEQVIRKRVSRGLATLRASLEERQ